MKTDLVLTMDEYFDQCCIATKRVSPPAPDARHILITAGDNLDSGAEAHGIGGTIRAPHASNPGTRPRRTRQFLVG